jgi:hypothetical protein
MLVYIKSSARRWLLQPLSTEKDIPKHLATRASAEKIESENRDLVRETDKPCRVKDLAMY